MQEPYRMYGAEVSYFTAKVRPAFRAKRIFMEEILATPQAYADVILPRVGMAFIPVVITPENQTWQDSSEILDALERLHPEIPLYPTSPVQRVAAFLWEVYCDEFLIIPALHYRWSYEESERKARADFAAFSGGAEMTRHFADNIKAFTHGPCGVNRDTIPVIEGHVSDLLGRLEAHFSELPFLLGERPSFADCSLMGPMYAHFYLDAVPGRVLREHAPRTCHWIERMNHPDPLSFGDWFPGDTLPPTMRPLLELVGRDAVPVILDTARAFEAWAQRNARKDQEPPRFAGTHHTHIRNVEVERITSSYTHWMLQRVYDHYRVLSAETRHHVDAFFAGTGCEQLLSFEPQHRLGKNGFKLVFETSAL